jgi:hypothetical protein
MSFTATQQKIRSEQVNAEFAIAAVADALDDVAVVTLHSQSFGASQGSFTLFLADGNYQVTGVKAIFGTASSSGTAQVEVATGTQAVGSGTVQLTGTVSLAGTANTVVNGTLITTPTAIAAGNRVNVILAGTLTSLANAVITVTLKRL